MLMEIPGRPSEVENGNANFADDTDRLWLLRRRSSAWSTASSNGVVRRASMVRAAVVVFGRRPVASKGAIVTRVEE